jgi:hypothetical protein
MTSTPGERPARYAGVSATSNASASPGDAGAAAPDGQTPRRRRALAGAALLLAALPAILYLRLVPRTGRLQWHDYYIVLLGMRVGDHLHADIGRWLTIKSNEHTVTIPALIYAANLVLFRGDNRPLAAFAVLAQLALVLLLLGRAPPDLRESPVAALLAAGLLGGLAFTPTGAHQFVLGFSGVMWVTADLLAVAAVLSLQRAAGAERPVPWLLVALAAAGAGVVTFSTALAVWPALLLGALLLRRTRRELPLLVLATLAAGHVAAALYQRPSHHPELELTHIGALASFVALFLGWIFTSAAAAAALVGWAGLLAAGALWLVALRLGDRARHELLPWLLLQVYGLGNAAMAAVARIGFGGGAAAQSRYALVAALFWIGVFGAAGVLLWRYAQRRWRTFAGVGFAALAVVAVTQTWRTGARGARALLNEAAFHPVAEIAVRYNIADDWAFRHFQNESAKTWLDGVGRLLRSFLQAQRHVPFDRAPTPGFGALLPPAERAEASPPDVAGEVVRVTALAAGVQRVEGWVDPGAGEIDGAVVVAADGTVRGELAALPRVPGAPTARRPGAVVIAGYAAPRSPGEKLQVVVRRRPDRRFYPVGKPWSR